MKDGESQYIDEDLKNGSPGAWRNIADSLNRFAAWHGAEGTVKLSEGNVEGWYSVHRSWRYRVFALRIRLGQFERTRGLGPIQDQKTLSLECGPSALCLAYALIFDAPFEQDFFRKWVSFMWRERSVMPETHWKYHHLEPFIFHLSCLAKGISDELDTLPKLGVYEGIFENWNDLAGLSKALVLICDYHCTRIEDKSKDFIADFRDVPFDLVPAEVLAVYAVRKRLKLETPEISHPLWQPPFNTPIGNPVELEDDLLDRLEVEM